MARKLAIFILELRKTESGRPNAKKISAVFEAFNDTREAQIEGGHLESESSRSPMNHDDRYQLNKTVSLMKVHPELLFGSNSEERNE
jgi:hypothetical protein